MVNCCQCGKKCKRSYPYHLKSICNKCVKENRKMFSEEYSKPQVTYHGPYSWTYYGVQEDYGVKG